MKNGTNVKDFYLLKVKAVKKLKMSESNLKRSRSRYYC